MNVTHDIPDKVTRGVLVMQDRYYCLLRLIVCRTYSGGLHLSLYHFNGREQSISLRPFVRCCASGKCCR